MLEGMRGESYSFTEFVSGARSRFGQSFLTGTEELLIRGVDSSYEEEYALSQEEIHLVADQCRKDETKKMVNVVEASFFAFVGRGGYLILSKRNFKRSISEPVEMELMKPTPDMWDKVLTAFCKTLAKSEGACLTKAKGEPHLFIHVSEVLTTS
jgi:hypothetical protein